MSDILIRHADHATQVGPFRLTQTGMEVEGEPTFDQWSECGQFLQRAGKAVQWWIGDWLNYGEGRYGSVYREALEVTGLDKSTLKDIKWVSSVVERSRRHDNLTFKHHREVASLPPDTADELLNRAEAENLSAKTLRVLVSQAKAASAIGAPVASDECCTTTELSALVSRNLKFGTIYADPPWSYSNQGTRASTDNHYGTMTVDDIAALPVRDLAADEAHLWLWTTNAFLFDCPRLFEAWGFEFKSSYIWVKPQMGIGNYLRNSHEFLLLAVRGGLTAAARDVMSWGEFDRTEHSAKPEKIRSEVIEKISPGPRLELFGRRVAPGWVIWGNQITKTMFDTNVRELV